MYYLQRIIQLGTIRLEAKFGASITVKKVYSTLLMIYLIIG